jgi:hypothetical protein
MSDGPRMLRGSSRKAESVGLQLRIGATERIDKEGHVLAAGFDAVAGNAVAQRGTSPWRRLRRKEIKFMPAGAEENPGQPNPLKQAVFMAAIASLNYFYAL